MKGFVMSKKFEVLAAAATALALLAAPAAWAESDSANQVKQPTVEEIAVEAANIVRSAKGAVERLRERPLFVEAMGSAKAIVIFPDVIKGGFLISGQAGSGVLLTRGSDGSWSAPAFYTITAAGVGLQAGAEISTIGLIIRTDTALNAFFDGGFKLGGGIDLTLVALGGTAELDTAADIISFTAAKGAFAGLSVEGSNFAAERTRNAAYYGSEMTTQDVVSGAPTDTPEIQALHQALAGL